MAVVLDPDICSTGSAVTNRCFGVGDGIRTVFNLAGLDSRRALLAPQIYLDQALQTYTTHYTTDSTGKVTFGTAPAAGKQVQYKEPHLPSVNVYRSFGVGDGASVNFSLPFAPATPSIYVDGSLKTLTTDYAVTPGGVVTFVSAPAAGAVLTWTGSMDSYVDGDYVDGNYVD